MPLQGEDLQLAALSGIYRLKEKVQKKNFEVGASLRAYTNLLKQS